VGMATRAGLHTGACEVWPDGLGGAAVEVVRRVVASATVGQVLASSTVKDLVAGSGIKFKVTGQDVGELPIFTVVLSAADRV
jgi:class 3 adenylate cyclase